MIRLFNIFKSKKPVIVQISNSDIDVYVKGSNKRSNNYIHYPIKRFKKDVDRTSKKSNYDIWRISGCYEVSKIKDDNFKQNFQIAHTGEWELAIREIGANDAIGGSFHGDEIMNSFELFIDGKSHDSNNEGTFYCKSLSLKCHSNLFRDNTITPDSIEKVGEHIKIYNFSQDGLKLDQKVVFNESMRLGFAYLGMLPILRLEKYTEGLQITDKATSDIDSVEFDVSKEGFETDISKRRNGIKKLSIYGETSKVSATVEILNRNIQLRNENSRIDNPRAYNKFYIDFSGRHETHTGEVWEQTLLYKIDTKN